jgi:hypothetical protein
MMALPAGPNVRRLNEIQIRKCIFLVLEYV